MDTVGTVRVHTIIGSDGHLYTIDLAKEIAPGLLVYRLLDSMHRGSPYRWRISHHSGLSVADAMRREDACVGAELLSTLADWTKPATTLRTELNPTELFAKLSRIGCVEPATDPT
ncbi:hypothetical protein ACH4GZ_38755 [Streptomyces hygroscopicus]|uniref:hypothetical protein n=1 Tax=Streptomyces hygroscopicus TaxID=1912 RepID=UPI003799938C